MKHIIVAATQDHRRCHVCLFCHQVSWSFLSQFETEECESEDANQT